MEGEYLDPTGGAFYLQIKSIIKREIVVTNSFNKYKKFWAPTVFREK